MGPRSVKDATRFTSTIPHATSKTAGGAAGGAAPKQPPRIPGETPEQRVKRLRQAHIAAQKAQISRTDRVVDASRRFLDVAHRWTVGGIVVFTGTSTWYLGGQLEGLLKGVAIGNKWTDKEMQPSPVSSVYTRSGICYSTTAPAARSG